MTDGALAMLTEDFAMVYSDEGRPSIPPEQLLRALLLQVVYSVRRERLLMEQMHYNPLGLHLPRRRVQPRADAHALGGHLVVNAR